MPADGGIRFGNYLLLRRIARGGMAEVFLAQQRGLEGFDRRVAVKRILPHLADSPDFVKMFLGEAKLAAQLTHPNIVHIYDFGKVDHDYFIAMEYVEGVHTGQLFKQSEHDRMPPTMLARIGADAAAALHYAHELDGPNGKPLGLVHRDVSPANLMISYDGVVKLCDFGIAKATVLTDQRTNPGQVKGKYAYMSPEQTVASQLDGRSDVFSLAIVLWELLAGKTIVARGDPIAAMRAIRDGKLQPLSQAAPHVPALLADAIAWGLATRREERATAAELATALEAFIKASPDLATPMHVGAWVRSRFPREALTGPQQAISLDTGAGPGTMAVPGTVAGTVGGGTGTGMVPATPAAPRSEPDDMSETLAIIGDPDAGVETIIVEEKARPLSKRVTARQLPTVSDDRSRRGALETTKRDPAQMVADRPTVIAAPGSPASAGSGPRAPNVLNPSALAGSGPRAQPNVLNPSALAGAAPRAQPIDETLHVAPAESSPALRTGPRAFAPSPGSQPMALDPRLRAAPVLTGTEAIAGVRARVPRRVALVGGLAAIAVGSFLLALVVCSPPRPAAAPDAALVAEEADARAAGAPADAAADPPAGADAALAGDARTATIPPDAALKLQLYKVDTRPSGGTVQIDDQRRAAPAEFMLPPGRYTVIAELDGWQQETRPIELFEGADLAQEIPFTRRIHIVRAPQIGTLTVRTTPYSDVYIGTRKIGQAPFADMEVPAGTYWLTFKNPRHPTVRKQVTVVAGRLTKLPPFSLPP